MEHEVYVPLSVGSVRAALTDSARVARCVPGFQQEQQEQQQQSSRSMPTGGGPSGGPAG